MVPRCPVFLMLSFTAVNSQVCAFVRVCVCAPYVDFYINRVLKETERKFPRSHPFIAASIDCLGCRVKHLWLGKWKGVPNQLCFDLIFNFRSGAMRLIDFHSNWIEFPQEGRKSVSIFRPVIPTIIKNKNKKNIG